MEIFAIFTGIALILGMSGKKKALGALSFEPLRVDIEEKSSWYLYLLEPTYLRLYIQITNPTEESLSFESLRGTLFLNGEIFTKVLVKDPPLIKPKKSVITVKVKLPLKEMSGAIKKVVKLVKDGADQRIVFKGEVNLGANIKVPLEKEISFNINKTLKYATKQKV